MKRVFSVAIAALVALQPTPAAAQIFNGTPFDVEYLQFLSGSGQGGAYGVQVGPYSGRFLGNDVVAPEIQRSTTTLPFALYCVDFQHYASNSTGLVTATSLDLGLDWASTNTRLQSFGAYQRAAYLSSLFDSWEVYEAELESIYGYDFTKSNVWGGLHAAIWDATTGPGYGPGGKAELAMEFFMGLAGQNAGGYDTSGWYILSEANDLDGQYSGQEFLMRVSVPEPSTLLLMMTGILLLIWVRRRPLVGLEG